MGWRRLDLLQFTARTTTNNYQSFNYEPATESEFNRQPVFKPEYIQPQPNFAQDREYKNPGYTSAFKTTKKPIQVAQKKPTDSFVKPFASEDFSFESQKFDIQKEIQQPTEDNSQAYYEDEYEQGPPAAPSGFFHHDNLKNHKLDTTTERFYQEEFYGANSNQDQGPSFFSDQAKNSFFSGNTGDNSPQQPGSGVVESYNPPQNYQPSQQTFQKPPPFTAFSTTERNAAQAFRGNSESFSQNQDSFFPPTSSNPSIYDIKNQEDENSNNNNQGSFTPPKLVERFSVPLVEPSLPFSPPEQQEETHHEHETFEHKEQHEFNGGQVTVERFPAEPVPSPYVPPTQQPALPPYAPAQQPNKQYKEKKPVLSKKPLVPEHKYEQKNYRKPVVAPSSTSEDHPILRVKPAQHGKQQPQQQQAPAEYRSIKEPQGFGPYMHTPGQLEIKEVTREVTTARQLPEFDNDQEIITAFSDFKKSSSHSNKQTFNVNVHASFSPSLNPEDAQRTARGAPLAHAPQARRGGPKRQTIRMKVNPAPQTSSHTNNNKKHRFIRRH